MKTYLVKIASQDARRDPVPQLSLCELVNMHVAARVARKDFNGSFLSLRIPHSNPEE